MATSNERREIAARLRDDDHGYETEYDFLVQALGMPRENHGQCDWSKVHERLADLIDPTCYIVPLGERLPHCSKCGQPILKPWPNFCPNCGARVTSGGEG